MDRYARKVMSAIRFLKSLPIDVVMCYGLSEFGPFKIKFSCHEFTVLPSMPVYIAISRYRDAIIICVCCGRPRDLIDAIDKVCPSYFKPLLILKFHPFFFSKSIVGGGGGLIKLRAALETGNAEHMEDYLHLFSPDYYMKYIEILDYVGLVRIADILRVIAFISTL